MSIQKIADDITAMLKAGQFGEAGAKYWADTVVSLEPGGPMPRVEGKAGAVGKGEWWAANHEIHSTSVEGPLVNNDQFILRITMDVTQKATGQRMQMDETALYTIKNGKIAEERFFYAMG